MQTPGKIFDAFIEELFGIINREEPPEDPFPYDPKKVMEIILIRMRAMTEVNELELEIRRILGSLGERRSFIVKTYSIEDLVIGAKYYFIAWSTLKDIMINLINVCFDLGIDERDVKYGILMRNRKVKDSNIPGILNDYRRSINTSKTDEKRNTVVHRGRLDDDEINAFRKKQNALYAKIYSLLETNPISEDEFNSEQKALNDELSNLVKLKRQEYTVHFDNTVALNVDLARELARVTAAEVVRYNIE